MKASAAAPAQGDCGSGGRSRRGGCWTLSIDPSRGAPRNLNIQFGHHHSGVVVAVPRWSSVTALSSRIQTTCVAMTALETGPMRTNFLLVSLMPTKTCSRNRQAPFITKHKNDRSANGGMHVNKLSHCRCPIWPTASWPRANAIFI